MANNKQVESIAKTLMFIEYLGIHIEDVKEIYDDNNYLVKVVYDFSVPEASTIKLNNEFDEKIQCSDGLIALAKKEIMGSLFVFYDEFGENQKISEFCVKVRRGEQWNEDLGSSSIKSLTGKIKNNECLYDKLFRIK